MRSRYSPEEHLAELTQSSIGFILIMGAVLFPVLEFMDYFVMPQKFARFMVYRLGVSSFLVLLYFLNKLRRNKTYQYAIAAAGAIMSAVTVELGVLESGGQSSTYYAAMIILTICCLGFAPINLGWSFVLIGIVYTVYAVPILLTEDITGGVFVSNNAFLIATFVIGILLRYNSQKLLISEFNLRAELSEDKRKLEAYSDSLKDQVAVASGALAITEQKYRALFDHANDGIAVLDAFGNITDVNLRYCELHGYECNALRGTNVRVLEVEHVRGEINDRIQRILDGESLVYEAEHYRKNGSRVLLEISSRAITIGGVPHIQSFHRDITEKMKLQEQVLQSQKMDSMGLLAGGIAHDFQNVLTGILAHTEVLRRLVKTDDFGKRRIKTIEDAAKRAGQMISKLLSFARKESLELVPSNLNSVVQDSVELLGRTLLDRNIRLRMALDPDPAVINGDSIHLEQVIANLVMNSSDAMPEGGVIAISTGRRVIEADTEQAFPFLPAGSYAVLTVRDTGKGIPREIMDKIFDPFFTTKPAGKGTGLGLAIVYGIVKSHKGEIRMESRENEGTSFQLFFPVLKETPFCRLGEAPPAQTGPRRPGICVVDDEEDTLSCVCGLLETEGYRVFACSSPENALELFRTRASDIDLVLTDMVMPVMNGAELRALLKQERPGIAVVGMSGYMNSEELLQKQTMDGFLRKPFESTELLAAVRNILGTHSRGSAAK